MGSLTLDHLLHELAHQAINDYEDRSDEVCFVAGWIKKRPVELPFSFHSQ